MLKGRLPALELKPDKNIVDFWLTPYMSYIKREMRVLF